MMPARGSPARDEAMLIALLLAFAGGYLDAYTWIVHGVMANAQTANLVLLSVYGSVGNWPKAIHFAPPMFAFAMGVAVAAALRHAVGPRASAICVLIEILLLVMVGVLHNRLPDLAGTLGISFVAAMQAAVFTRVEGATYSSVMVTGNMRQAIESLLAILWGRGRSTTPRHAWIFVLVCLAFGAGAAIGAFATQSVPNLTLIAPVLALLMVLLRCEAHPLEADR